MSLLMQALRKAGRNKPDLLPYADAGGLALEAYGDALAQAGAVEVDQTQADNTQAGVTPAGRDSASGTSDLTEGAGMDATPAMEAPSYTPRFTLELLDAPVADVSDVSDISDADSINAPALHAAMEAEHDPTPPQSRRHATNAPVPVPLEAALHEPRMWDSAVGVTPPSPSPAPPGSAGAGVSAATGAATGAAAAAAAGSAAGAAVASKAAAARARAAAQAAADADRPGLDPARVRLAVLGAALALVAIALGGVYWYATTAPGPGAKLPPVPMPPPGAVTGTPALIVAAPQETALPSFPGAGDGQAATAVNLPETSPSVANPAAPAPSTASSANSAAAAPAQPSTPASRAPSDDELQRAMQQGSAPSQAAGIQERRPAPLRPAAPPSVPAGNTGNDASDNIRVSRSNTPPRVSPALQNGYQAFVAGDMEAAARHYAAALRQDPNNRDALLGHAAVAMRRNDSAAAAGAYQRLLELNPSDPDAQAGLLSLRPGDTGQSELRLKEMLRREPGSGALHFALGNVYARQGRWTEAQQAYFSAYSANPDNADFAVNLAIGLDRLNQRKLALSYYQRALALAQQGAAAFDREAVQRRVAQLAAAGGNSDGRAAAPNPDSRDASADINRNDNEGQQP